MCGAPDAIPVDPYWRTVARGHRALQEYVNVFKSVAPAKMYICMTFEAEMVVEGTFTGRSVAGSSADYRAQWQHAYNYFRQQGVTNAVWAMGWLRVIKPVDST